MSTFFFLKYTCLHTFCMTIRQKQQELLQCEVRSNEPFWLSPSTPTPTNKFRKPCHDQFEIFFSMTRFFRVIGYVKPGAIHKLNLFFFSFRSFVFLVDEQHRTRFSGLIYSSFLKMVKRNE